MRPAEPRTAVLERQKARQPDVTAAEDTLSYAGNAGGVEVPAASSTRVSAEVAAENAAWIRDLSGGDLPGESTRRKLFDFLLRAASVEARWRSPYSVLNGPELDDLAQQAAADALLLIVEKIHTFRGDCRFTTWAYRFAALIVGSKISRHPWHRRNRPFQVEEWLDSPAWSGDEPEVDFEARELQSIIRRVVMTNLTPYQRQVLMGSIVDGMSADDLAERVGSNRNAIYKVLFDARQKVRVALKAEGFAFPSRG